MSKYSLSSQLPTPQGPCLFSIGDIKEMVVYESLSSQLSTPQGPCLFSIGDIKEMVGYPR